MRNVIVWEIVTCGKGSISGASEFTLGFYWDSCYSIFSFMCMFYRSLFVLLSIFFWPLHCMFFFDLRIRDYPFGIFKPFLISSQGGHSPDTSWRVNEMKWHLYLPCNEPTRWGGSCQQQSEVNCVASIGNITLILKEPCSGLILLVACMAGK